MTVFITNVPLSLACSQWGREKIVWYSRHKYNQTKKDESEGGERRERGGRKEGREEEGKERIEGERLQQVYSKSIWGEFTGHVVGKK